MKHGIFKFDLHYRILKSFIDTADISDDDQIPFRNSKLDARENKNCTLKIASYKLL